MREDLLNRIAGESDVTNAIVLTHNIDFVFLQTVVLSALRRSGQPTVTVFADAGCAAEAFSRQYPVLRDLGIRYRVVPVAMEHGFRFHPKAVLLSGGGSATLYVGSGNLTFGGWRENAEVWARYSTKTDGTGPFSGFQQYLQDILERVPLPTSVRAEVGEAFDPRTRVWAAEMESSSTLVGKVGRGPAMLDRMVELLGNADRPVECLTICSPYFDGDGDALAELLRRVQPRVVKVLIQPGRSTLTQEGWARLGAGSRLVPVTFRRSEAGHEAFVHAKWYAFERDGAVTVFAGSANCSRAALTIPGAQCNAELVFVRTLTREEFDASFVSELTELPSVPLLASKGAIPTGLEPLKLQVLASRYEGGQLQVAYSPEQAQVTACSVDKKLVPFGVIAPGVLDVRMQSAPKLASLRAMLGDTELQSASSWVDQERELRASARSRCLVEAIRAGVRPDAWSVGAWTEVLDVFCKHLGYMPSRYTVLEVRPGSRPAEAT
jgi:hypothetical protein